ncbi:MAG: OsmC family protein [Chloroflexota bacterium]
MSENSELEVGYRREGDDVHVLTLGIPALPEIRIDYTGIPIEDRGGTAARLLAAAALYCFSSTVGAALKGRGAEIKTLEGTAVASKGKDMYYRTKVTDIKISLNVEVDEKSAALVQKAEQIADRGCFITYSISEGIDVEHLVTCPVAQPA